MKIPYDTEWENSLSVTIGVGKTPVTLLSSDFNDISTSGLHFSLPPNSNIPVGTLKDLIDWINTKLSSQQITILDNVDSVVEGWPDYLAAIVKGVLNTTVSITALKIDQQAKDENGEYPPIEAEMVVLGKPMDPLNTDQPKPIDLIPGLFSVIEGGIALRRKIITRPADQEEKEEELLPPQGAAAELPPPK